MQMPRGNCDSTVDPGPSGGLPNSRLRSEEAYDAMRRNRGDMSSYLGSASTSVTMPDRRRIQVSILRSN